jgi:hypothetical protein
MGVRCDRQPLLLYSLCSLLTQIVIDSDTGHVNVIDRTSNRDISQSTLAWFWKPSESETIGASAAEPP